MISINNEGDIDKQVLMLRQIEELLKNAILVMNEMFLEHGLKQQTILLILVKLIVNCFLIFMINVPKKKKLPILI